MPQNQPNPPESKPSQPIQKTLENRRDNLAIALASNNLTEQQTTEAWERLGNTIKQAAQLAMTQPY